jgi:hypothetical protein
VRRLLGHDNKEINIVEVWRLPAWTLHITGSEITTWKIGWELGSLNNADLGSKKEKKNNLVP